MSYSAEDIPLLLNSFNSKDCRTWPFKVLPMPLKEGKGPVSEEECDQITYEVWDIFYDSYGSFEYLPDAINKCLELTHQLIILREIPKLD